MIYTGLINYWLVMGILFLIKLFDVLYKKQKYEHLKSKNSFVVLFDQSYGIINHPSLLTAF